MKTIAYEDNGGGLTIVLYDDNDNAIEAGVTDNPSASLAADMIAALEGNISDWSQYYNSEGNSLNDRDDEGNEITAQRVSDDCKRYVCEGNGGCTIIAEAETDSGSLHIYFSRVGNAGRKWIDG